MGLKSWLQKDKLILSTYKSRDDLQENLDIQLTTRRTKGHYVKLTCLLYRVTLLFPQQNCTWSVAFNQSYMFEESLIIQWQPFWLSPHAKGGVSERVDS